MILCTFLLVLAHACRDNYKVFLDLFNLSMYALPRDKHPKLPKAAIQSLNTYQAPLSHVEPPPDMGTANHK